MAAKRPQSPVPSGGAIAVLVGAVLLAPDVGTGLFGRPRTVLAETFARNDVKATYDHSLLDGVLKRFVDGSGLVDYAGLSKNAEDLDRYIESLAAAPLDSLGRDESLALLINAYNAFTLRLILDYYPIKSIRDIPEGKRWKHGRWRLAGKTLSLDQIEHEQIRPTFSEPRIHFALVCAAVDCPPLRKEAYTAAKLEAQLEAQTSYVHTHERWLRHDRDTGVLHLTSLYDWYGNDFEQSAGSVLDFVARYVPSVKAAMDAKRPLKIKWLDYDWSLNRPVDGE